MYIYMYIYTHTYTQIYSAPYLANKGMGFNKGEVRCRSAIHHFTNLSIAV